MKPSFCAIANRQSGEDLIGTAGHYQTYVLIECPRPWAAKVFNSETIPVALRDYIKSIKAERSIQFLAVDRGKASASNLVTVMVYERQLPSDAIVANAALSSTALSNTSLSERSSTAFESVKNYRGYEFQLDSLTQVVDCLAAHWQGDRIGNPIKHQDILICTHGMRDKCCARFGHPLFREAARSAAQGRLPNTRIWKVSHIGGHRFAPTAISLPDGRYYGRLTIEALESIVARSGSVHQLSAVYRGWGMLPAPLQILERQLMLHRGWSWFDCTVNYRILADRVSKDVAQASSSSIALSTTEKPSAKSPRELSVEVSVILADAARAVYRAKVVQDPTKTVCTKVSCDNAVAVPVSKYTIAECIQVNSAVADSPAVSSTT
ncbi:MAG: sucrase ferredoxin, partial [Cyanobacteria bacterium J06649_4]